MAQPGPARNAPRLNLQGNRNQTQEAGTGFQIISCFSGDGGIANGEHG